MIGRYLGGYIGKSGLQAAFMGDKVWYWEDGISTMTGVERKHTQAAYA